MKHKYIGQPIASEHTLGGAFKCFNGTNYLCTTVSGVPPKLNIYNLDDNKVEMSFDLEDGLNSWNHRINADGNLYVVSSGRFYKYDFSENKFYKYGKIPGCGESFVMDNDEKGNMYIGSCPGGNIYKYDIEKDEIYDMGKVTDEAVYVRSISYLNGYLYCGIKGDNYLSLYKISIDDPSKKYNIPLPEDKEYYPEGLRWVYTSTVIGEKIVFHCKGEDLCPLLIYDTKKEAFIDTGYKGNFPGLFVSPIINSKSYFVCDGQLMEIDAVTGRISQCDFPFIECPDTKVIGTVKDKLTGKTLLALFNTLDVSVIYINLEEKKTYKKRLNLEKSAYYIQSLEYGDYNNQDNAVYLSAYCGDDAVRYDIETGLFENIKVGQCEGMLGFNGKQYMGVYPHCELYIYDRKKSSNQPQYVGKMSKGQDRPFAMCAGDGCVFMGTVPDYGKRGGDIIIYNTENGTCDVISTPVSEQSIIGLQYDNGLLYGSTSVWGGLGSVPDECDAKIFIYDLKSNCLRDIFTPEIPGIEHPTWIGSVKIDNEGNLWGVTGNTLFLINIETKKVLKYITFGNYTYSRVRHRWRPTYIRFDKKGYLYTNILGIQKVNVNTMEYEKITKEEDDVFLFTIDSSDNIYYAVDNNFYLIESEG